MSEANKVQPIKPGEIAKAKQDFIPDEVLSTFNRLIAENYSDGSATVKQCDVVDWLTRDGRFRRTDLFDRGWLNVEEIYRSAGWKVEYDKPGYNETYQAYYVFTPYRGVPA